MSVNFRYPNITGRTEREQLDQMKSYMYQMVDQLNYAMHNQSGSGQAGADIKNGSETVGGVATEKATFLKAAYPIGAVYISTVATNPKTLFGFGTWEQIKDTFLLAAGSTYSAGSTGGEAEHTLTTDEMPGHSHPQNARVHGYSGWGQVNTGTGYTVNISTSGNNYHAPNSTLNAAIVRMGGTSTSATGGSGAHNNMPPYLAVYVWQRTE